VRMVCFQASAAEAEAEILARSAQNPQNTTGSGQCARWPEGNS
jgi:hypothetical protein